MAHISRALLERELLEWIQKKNNDNIHKKNEIPLFGKYMSDKYLWDDEELSQETSLVTAYDIIESKYVQVRNSR